MILYALKSDQGYLRMIENDDFLLVGINKASVYPESELNRLKKIKEKLGKHFSELRIVKLTLEETDFYS